MITRYPWFGPKKHLGWGWTPITWEGWLVTLLFCVAARGVFVLLGPGLAGTAGLILCIVALIATCFLTGTKPGGPGL